MELNDVYPTNSLKCSKTAKIRYVYPTTVAERVPKGTLNGQDM